MNNFQDFQQLLMKIFGEEKMRIYIEKPNPQKIIEEIRKIHTLEEYMKMTAKERGDIKLIIGARKIGLYMAAGILGSGGKPVGNSQDFKNLMIKVFGESEMKEYLLSLK